ncbi:helix-turn-helix domain-containing protein [Cytophagaceae bacterium YF14B1]|uniref:Helix-turn-helix domain-containing protein n=1 Tax=Xanthocytophaga flava TaxID=3048013 RepID=A0AAE3QMP8_9BACT|nr:helix-turn-helix domain-containing protein [Xanthocytophaga flavus]MDJ1479890.1 helix-turn-helix domain-containing protein [Xanthocytophaga flavus]
MISHTTQSVSKADIFLTCTEESYYSNELIVQKNTLIRMISGEMKIILPDATYVLGGGDTIFFPHNELAKVMKTHKDGKPYRSVAIYLTPEAVQLYFLKHHQEPVPPTQKPVIKLMEKHPLLDSLFGSLVPYFDLKNELPEYLAEAKVDEAISILKWIDEDLFNAISHFEEPGKVNLTEFMEKNFMFNMSMDQFGYLTGRSLTTFKRDFKRAFSTTPQRWLTQKRLTLAHYQITQHKRKPVEVYLEVGFENLSHFSYAFKKQFGYSPSELVETR